MSRKIYWEDAYAKEFDAKVTSLSLNRVSLDQSAFNPRGGGLVSDLGKIGETNVIEVIKENDEPVHLVERPELLKVNETVHCVLDWERRYKVMRMHTSAHILCAIVNRETGASNMGITMIPKVKQASVP